LSTTGSRAYSNGVRCSNPKAQRFGIQVASRPSRHPDFRDTQMMRKEMRGGARLRPVEHDDAVCGTVSARARMREQGCESKDARAKDIPVCIQVRGWVRPLKGPIMDPCWGSTLLEILPFWARVPDEPVACGVRSTVSGVTVCQYHLSPGAEATYPSECSLYNGIAWKTLKNTRHTYGNVKDHILTLS